MKRNQIRVELLYFDGCPSYEALLPHVRDLLDRADLNTEVELRRVASEEDALRLRFSGSPTVRVDGRDVEPGADDRVEFGLQCRLYRTAEGTGGTPPDEWILCAIGVYP